MSTVIDGSASVTINNGTVLGITSGTAVASTSGTSIDFTSLPAWVKRLTVMFAGVSTNSTSNPLFQLGAGSVTTSGYLGAGSIIWTSVTTNNYTTGFGFPFASATDVIHGSIGFTLVGSNIWVANGCFSLSSATYTAVVTGSITLSGTLDRVRITTVSGTPTFDAGTINIMYEG
jgi:hypothetical protein